MMLFSDTKKWWAAPRASYLVLVIFLVTYFYQGHILTYKVTNEEQLIGQEENTGLEKPTLTTLAPERLYEHIIQAKSGDIFRLGFVAQSRTEQKIEIILQSILGERITVGSLNLIPSEGKLYYEMVFSVPGRSEDILLRLGDSENDAAQSNWLPPEVYLASLFVTRLDVHTKAEAERLNPTYYGAASSFDEPLTTVSQTEGSKNRISWAFEAKGDALGELLIPESLSRLDGYFSLYKEHSQWPDTALAHVTFDAPVRERTRLHTGTYRLPLSYPLQKGEQYRLVFEAASHDVSLSTLLSKAYESSPIIIYRSFETRNGGVLLNSARLEDVGRELLYSYSIQNKQDDFLNISSLSQKVHFDGKKKRVVGARKKDEFYTYRFDTLYPFERFALEARSGSTKNGVTLEFSSDNATWIPVSLIRESGQPDRFLLSLSGTGEMRVVYVRIRYTGDEKKTGSFSLDQLSVNARISKK